MFTTRRTLTAALLTLSLSAHAASPIGTWKTIDDNSGNAKSYVTIFANDNTGSNTLSGKVTKILIPNEQGSLCELCKDERKNQPVQGMTILWGMERDGDQYDGGNILDPESGKIYSASMRLLDNGQKLEVRGYIGFSLIGRSQIWERLKDTDSTH